MNRTNDTHFFSLWDKMKQLENDFPVRPKDLSEWLDEIDAVEQEAGFGTYVSYQEAIELYNQKKEQAERLYDTETSSE